MVHYFLGVVILIVEIGQQDMKVLRQNNLLFNLIPELVKCSVLTLYL